MIKKGFTLEVMGDYEGAVEALLRAAPRLDRQTDPLLWYSQRFNLAAAFVQLGRCAEAAELVPEIRDLAADLGDTIFLSRLTWLEGRIAAGLGRRAEALGLLGDARRDFAQRKPAPYKGCGTAGDGAVGGSTARARIQSRTGSRPAL